MFSWNTWIINLNCATFIKKHIKQNSCYCSGIGMVEYKKGVCILISTWKKKSISMLKNRMDHWNWITKLMKQVSILIGMRIKMIWMTEPSVRIIRHKCIQPKQNTWRIWKKYYCQNKVGHFNNHKIN